MPNRNELQSLVDYGRYNPAINTDYFPDTSSCFGAGIPYCGYWSSTTGAGVPSFAWFFDFYGGDVDLYGSMVGGIGKSHNNYYVRAVRGGEGGPITTTTVPVTTTTTTISVITTTSTVQTTTTTTSIAPTTSTTLPPTTTTITPTTTVPPTVVSLIGFNATPGSNAVTLVWSTASEIENAGFNLYRSDSAAGKYIKINSSLIPSQGSSTQGAAYEFIDNDVKNRKTYYYKLEDIDLNGESTMHGPVSAMPRWIYGIDK